MNEIIEISRGDYSSMWFFIGFLLGLLLSPFILWCARMIKNMADDSEAFK